MDRVYVVEVDKGSWDSWVWWVHGIYDDPFKADESKRLYEAKVSESRSSKDELEVLWAKDINSVKVVEYPLNQINFKQYER